MTPLLPRDTVALVTLDPVHGHEQRGTRPCVIVSTQGVSSHQRFPMVCVVPLTATPGEGLLYPRLDPGPSGLRKTSWALVDQIPSVDKRHITRLYGTVSNQELSRIDDAIRSYLGLEP